MRSEDHHILARMIRGEEAAAVACWKQHAPGLLAYARALLGKSGEEDAQDVVQGVFCTLIRRMKPRDVERIDNVRAWLIRLVRNGAANQLRSARRRRLRERTLGPGPGCAGAVAGDDLARALAMLPRREHEVIVLRHVCGLSFEEAAAATGLARSTLHDRYVAGIAKLREMLGADHAIGTRKEIAHAH